MNQKAEFGIIGMGVMGKNLALHLAKQNVGVSIYNRHVAGKEEGVAHGIKEANPDLELYPFDQLQSFLDSLEEPRKILLMITAAAVDAQLEELVPLLNEGDIAIDGGNSYYIDTEVRAGKLKEKGVLFLGTGISGGEEGALHGAAIMPGGDRDAYQFAGKYLELLAAKDMSGKPCASFIGPGGAGHFVKMVHNSIEYAEMQAIAETYSLLRFHLNISIDEIISLFNEWEQRGSGSFLLQVATRVLQKKENGGLLLDKILDQAAQKGTGGWSVATAVQLGVPYSALAEAVTARFISAEKSMREKLAALHARPAPTAALNLPLSSLKNSFDFTRLVNHETGFQLMKTASATYGWNLNLQEVARIWTNGCIIKSALMEKIAEALKTEASIFTAGVFSQQLQSGPADAATVVAASLRQFVPMPVFSAALNYYLGMTTAQSSANLIQAMRDYFGAHTYQRTDQPPEKHFHTIW